MFAEEFRVTRSMSNPISILKKEDSCKYSSNSPLKLRKGSERKCTFYQVRKIVFNPSDDVNKTLSDN